MPDKASRAARREQHAKEVEDSQDAMRRSIAETRRLVDESDETLKRHRRERDEDDAADGT